MLERRFRSLLEITVLALLYFAVAKLGLKLATVYPSATPVWLGTGLALAALLVFGYNLWPGIFIGAFLANILTAGSVWTSLATAGGNTLEGVLGAFLVCKYAGGRNTFRRPEDIFKFVFFAGCVATTISATVGTGSLLIGGFTQGLSQSRIWLTWWLGDLLGAIVLTPCLLLWSTDHSEDRNWHQIAHSLIAFSCLILTAVLLFSGFFSQISYSLAFLAIPILVWATFHLRPHEAATTVVIFSAIAVWGTINGHGGFVRPDPNVSLLLLQTFVAVLSMTSLVVSAAIFQRNQDQQALAKANDELEIRVMKRTEELRQRIADRERAEEALRELSSRLLQAQDEERRRIARELHDSTGQDLAFLNMSLSNLEEQLQSATSDGTKEIAEITATARKISDELRTISYLLHPPLLDELGLVCALRWYSDGFAERSNIKVSVEAPEDLERMRPEVETAIFRIVQESLTNIHRHSGSPTASIRVDRRPNGIDLIITDQGKGMPSNGAATNGTGVGLASMRERVHQFGGELQISSVEKGTRIKAFFPFSEVERR